MRGKRLRRTSRLPDLPGLLILLSCMSAGAFPGLAPSFSFGARSGVTFGALRGQGTDVLEDDLREDFAELRDDPMVAAMGGAFVAIHHSDIVALQAEVLYHRTGIAYVGTPPQGGEREFDITLDYLMIPVLLRLTIPIYDARTRPYMLAGPHLDVRLNAEVNGVAALPDNIQSLGILQRYRTTSDADDQTRGVDIGGTIGTGLEIKLGPGRVQIEFRASMGFVDVFDTDGLGDNAEEIKNKTLWLTGGYVLER